MSVSYDSEAKSPLWQADRMRLHPGQPADMPTKLFVAWMQILTDEEPQTNEQVLAALWASSRTELRSRPMPRPRGESSDTPSAFEPEGVRQRAPWTA